MAGTIQMKDININVYYKSRRRLDNSNTYYRYHNGNYTIYARTWSKIDNIILYELLRNNNHLFKMGESYK